LVESEINCPAFWQKLRYYWSTSTINEKRLKEQQEQWKELQQTVEVLKSTIGKKELTTKETQGLLEMSSMNNNSTRQSFLLRLGFKYRSILNKCWLYQIQTAFLIHFINEINCQLRRISFIMHMHEKI
jgi:hypothetical protein